MTEFEHTQIDAYQGYDLWAPIYDYWKHPVLSMASRHALRVLSPQPGEYILDAGCGTGRNLKLILEAGAEAAGIDFNEAMLGQAAKRAPGARLSLGDLQRPLAFDNDTFDGVLCSLAAEHLENLPLTMQEFRRVLKPAGRLVLAVAHPDFDGVVTAFRGYGITYFIPTYRRGVDDYVEAVADADFEALLYREFNGNAELTSALPAARVHEGEPVLLIVAAQA